MQNIKFILLLICLTALCGCQPRKNPDYKTLDGFAQGSTYHIVYEEPASFRENTPPSIEDSLALYFGQLDRSVSGYNRESVLSALNRGENVPLDPIFIEVFNESRRVYELSGGYFDISAGPLFDLWGFGFKDREKVTREKIDSIRQFVGMDKLEIIKGDGSTEFPDSLAFYLKKEDPRTALNFNAIAQGYTCDYIARRFDAMGIPNYLIEVGGEVYAKGMNARGEEWTVGIDKPVDGNVIQGADLQEIIRISDQGLVTSGNYRKCYMENGKKYSHTIDPLSGYPVEHNLLCAVVISSSATLSDAYATYFMVVGLEKAREILAGIPEMEAYLVYGDQQDMKVYYTPGLEKKLVKN